MAGSGASVDAIAGAVGLRCCPPPRLQLVGALAAPAVGGLGGEHESESGTEPGARGPSEVLVLAPAFRLAGVVLRLGRPQTHKQALSPGFPVSNRGAPPSPPSGSHTASRRWALDAKNQMPGLPRGSPPTHLFPGLHPQEAALSSKKGTSPSPSSGRWGAFWAKAGERSSGPPRGLESGQAWEATPGQQAVLFGGAILLHIPP